MRLPAFRSPPPSGISGVYRQVNRSVGIVASRHLYGVLHHSGRFRRVRWALYSYCSGESICSSILPSWYSPHVPRIFTLVSTFFKVTHVDRQRVHLAKRPYGRAEQVRNAVKRFGKAFFGAWSGAFRPQSPAYVRVVFRLPSCVCSGVFIEYLGSILQYGCYAFVLFG